MLKKAMAVAAAILSAYAVSFAIDLYCGGLVHYYRTPASPFPPVGPVAAPCGALQFPTFTGTMGS